MLLKVKQEYLQSIYLAQLDENTNTVYDHDYIILINPYSENILLKISDERECYIKLFYRYDVVKYIKVLINNRVGWINSYIIENF